MRITDGIGVTLDGFDLNGTDEFGVSWKVNEVEDWESPPGNTGEVVQRQFADGGWLGPSFLEPKAVRAVGRLYAPDRPAARAAIDRLKAALPLKGLAPLVVSEDGRVEHRWVKVEGIPKVPRPTDVYAGFDVLLIAPDSRLLGGDGSTPYQSSATAYLPSTIGGLQLPVSAPFSIGATVIGNSVTVTAQGNARPPVLVRIDGPVVQPIIRDGEGGQMVLAISLDAGQWLDVDLDARTIKINSQVSRRNVLRGQWITPRAGMTLSLDASVYNPDASMTVHWTDASY